MMRGSNVSGGDCPWTYYPASTGPVSGTNYQFVSNADIDRLLAEGMDVFRVLFSWECLQPVPWQTITANTGNYKIYFDKFKALVDYITVTKGATCIIDCHGGTDSSFGAYRGVKIGQRLSTGEAVSDLFNNLYWNLATVFKGNPKVQWGLTNEPIGMTTTDWFVAAQQAITTLRTYGAMQRVWAPGIGYTGASSWVTAGNAAAWNLTDTANNLGVQVHLYVDTAAGGLDTSIVNADIGVTRLKVAVDWCRSKGLKLIVGEIGMAASNPLAAQTWSNLLAYMESNADVVAGWCWWTTGSAPWWGTYAFNISSSPLGITNLGLVKKAFAPPPVADPKQQIIDNLTAQLASSTKTVATLQVKVTALTTALSTVKAAVATVLP